MKDTTFQIISGAIAGDDSIDEVSRKRILNAATAKQERRIWLTTRQTAELIGCSVITVRRYELRGFLHPVRRSARTKRFDQAEVLSFINSGIYMNEVENA